MVPREDGWGWFPRAMRYYGTHPVTGWWNKDVSRLRCVSPFPRFKFSHYGSRVLRAIKVITFSSVESFHFCNHVTIFANLVTICNIFYCSSLTRKKRYCKLKEPLKKWSTNMIKYACRFGLPILKLKNCFFIYECSPI